MSARETIERAKATNRLEETRDGSRGFPLVLLSTTLSVLLMLFTYTDSEAHPGGHPTKGYHYSHSGEEVLICQSVDDCHDLQEEIITSLPASQGGCEEGFHKNQTSGPSKYFNSHWTITTNGQCTYGGVPAGTNFGYTFIWYIDGMPEACNNGDDAPRCPNEDLPYMAQAQEAPPPDDCPAPNQMSSAIANESPFDKFNPCNPATGNKSQIEVDYESGGTGTLVFARYYNSLGAYNTAANFATGWRHTYSRSIDEAPDQKPNVLWAKPANQSALYATASEACTSGWNDIKDTAWSGAHSTGTASFVGGNVCKVSVGGQTTAHVKIRSGIPWGGYAAPSNLKVVTRPNGGSHTFELVGSDWLNELNSSVKLEQSGSNWIFTDARDTQETYNSAGQLTAIAYRNGQTETLSYNLTAAQGGDDDPDTLDKVTGPFGHTLTFAYTGGRLSSVTTPDGAVTYAYNADDNLITATYPDSTDREYVYEEDDFEFPNHLTGIIDENDDRFATWDYDDNGWAILSEHAGGKEQVQYAYNTDGSTTATTGNGTSRTYTFETAQGQRRLDTVTGDVCSTCSQGNTKSRDYDSNGYLSEITDWNNNVTKLTRNSRGLVETRTEAFGSTEERATTTTWHSTFRLPTKVTTPKNVTDYTYDANGNVLTATISGGGKSRAWTFTYNANGQVLTVNGPRTDVTDVTTLEYYTCTTGDECGQLKKVTNALGHVTNYDSYDAAGRLTQMTDANGLETAYTYDSRGRVLSMTETPTSGTARVTTMTYDDVGQLATYTLPNGVVLTYTYTAAHYLDSVTDNLGNEIKYDYDAMGNLTDEDTRDPQSTLKQALDYVIDQNYRLDSASHGPVTTDLAYDLVGNLTDVTDGNTALTQHSYDALNRLDVTTDAMLGLTNYDYDDHDNVTQVIAPNGATTTFAYDLLDNLTSETSPDRGVVSYTYDEAGNRLTQTDARGITGTYTYDALNRPTSITYPNTAENVTFTYDHAGSKGIGRLRSITDQAGTITLSYNEFGEVVTDQRQIGANTHTTTYAYDAGGNVSSMTYPSGRTVAYTRDAIGQISGVTSTKSSVQKTIVSSASYEPFGPLASITYGNGAIFDYNYRQDYRLNDFVSAALHDKDYSYDPAGNLVTINDGIDTARVQTNSYDALNRVTNDTQVSDYGGLVLADSPYLYYRLGEHSGTTVVDSSGNGHDGTYTGLVLAQTGLVAGPDTAVRSNAHTSDYAASDYLTTDVKAVEAWFQTDSISTVNVIVAVHRWRTDQMMIQHQTDGYVWVWLGGALVLSSDSTVATGQPHHVAVWYDAGANISYMMIDGVVQSNNYSGNILAVGNSKRVAVGAYLWNTGQFVPRYTGVIDEVAIYDTPQDASTFANRTLPLGGGAPITNTFTYDANGNRSTLDDGTAVTTYSYAAATNRLTGIAGSTVQRDASGNRTADVGGTRTYTYNDQNRLSAVLDSGATTASYVHNALGQRTKKTVGSSDIIYVYDLGGKLIAEHDATGALIRDYVWMNGAPVAQIDSGETFSYLHFDHLGTPRLATNDSQTIVWRWDSDAFGTTLPDEDPDGDSNGTTVNLRFPGQYFDTETGFHYNYFRTYDPSTSRYVESDPIGLAGGLNTFGYVGAAPLAYTDPYGLESYLVSRPLTFYDGASHNFVVTDANYLGDPSANVVSYGKNKDGNTGRVDEFTKGFSEGTSVADREYWLGLGDGLSCEVPVNNANVSLIPATDEVVRNVANSMLENTRYSPIPFGSRTNSNSAASAVANKAAGQKVPVNSDGRQVPGARKAPNIEFREPTGDLSQ